MSDQKRARSRQPNAERVLEKAMKDARANTSELHQQLQAAFAAIPQPCRAALQAAAIRCACDDYNHARFEEGDGIIAMLSDATARRFLDWYYDEVGPDEIPADLLEP